MSLLRRCLCRKSKEHYLDTVQEEQNVQDIQDSYKQEQEQEKELSEKEEFAHIRVKNAYKKQDRRLYTLLLRQNQTISSLDYQLKKLKHFIYKNVISEPITCHVSEESSVSEPISTEEHDVSKEEPIVTVPVEESINEPVLTELVNIVPVEESIKKPESVEIIPVAQPIMKVNESVDIIPVEESMSIKEPVLTESVDIVHVEQHVKVNEPVNIVPVEQPIIEIVESVSTIPSVITEPIVVTTEHNCTFIIKSGPNKGNHCKNKRVKGELYCSRHN